MSVLTSCRSVALSVSATARIKTRRYLSSSVVRRKALEGWKRPSIDEIGIPRESWQGVYAKNQQKYNIHLLAGVGLLGVTVFTAYNNIFTNNTPKFVHQTGFVTTMPKEGALVQEELLAEEPSLGSLGTSPAETIVIVEEAVEEAVKVAEEVVEVVKETLDVVKETIEKIDETVEEVKKIEDETKAIIDEGKDIVADSSKLIKDVKEVAEEAVEIISEVKDAVSTVVEETIEEAVKVKEEFTELLQEPTEVIKHEETSEE